MKHGLTHRKGTRLAEIACALGLLLCAGCGRQEHASPDQAQLEQELQQLRQENQELHRLRAENQELARLRRDNEELVRLQNEIKNLPRLRQEHEQLRAQLQALKAPKPRP